MNQTGLVQRPALPSYLAPRFGLAPSVTVPGLYNPAGLKRWYRARGSARYNSAGTGSKGARVRFIGDSLLRGMAATSPRYDTIAGLVRQMLQQSRYQGGAGGGEGLVLARCGDTSGSWAGVGNTIGAGTTQAVWTGSGTWTVTSAASINNLRCTGTSAASARMRVFFDPAISPVTTLKLIYGTETGGGTLTWDLTPGQTDAGFVTAGTASLTGTVSCNASEAGGLITGPAGLASLDPTVGYTLQVAVTSGTGYFEGCYAFNGDENSGLGCDDASRVGAASIDATWTTEARMVATFDKACARNGSADSFTECFITNMLTNDAAQDTSIANFKTNLGVIADRANTNSACMLFLVPMLYDTGYLTNDPTFEQYRMAIYEVAAARPGYCAVLDLYELQGSPTTVSAFEALPNLWIDTGSSRHHTNTGCCIHAQMIADALLAPAQF